MGRITRNRGPSEPVSTALVPTAKPGAVSVFDRRPDLVEKARQFVAASEAHNTRRGREADWAVFVDWCDLNGVAALPARPDDVAAFIADQANEKAVATLRRYLASISKMHELAGQPTPTHDRRVLLILGGIRRSIGEEQDKAAPLTRELLRRIQSAGVSERDWAVLCFGQATACRRSELCALDLADLSFADPRGLAVLIRKSKTDQTARGRVVAVRRYEAEERLCPVRAVSVWIAKRGTRPGPLFYGLTPARTLGTSRLCVDALNRLVKQACQRIGLDPDDYSGHSLRAGWVTDARQRGLTWEQVMKHTGHTQLRTVKDYFRGEEDPFEG